MLKSEQVQELLYFLEVGTAGGRNWLSVFKYLSLHSSQKKMKKFCNRFLELNQSLGQERALSILVNQSKNMEARLFFELLLLCDAGTRQTREIFSKYRKLLFKLQVLKKKKEGLSLLPQFQAISTIVICLFLVFIVPKLFPGFSAGFLSYGRSDLFLLGICGLVLGMASVAFVLWWPLRKQKSQLQTCIFLLMNAILTSSGCDLYTAWRRSLNSIRFPASWNKRLMRSAFKSESLENYLSEAALHLPKPWHQILDGLVWTLQAGGSVSDFLNECSEQLAEFYLMSWEQEVRKASFLSLAPLYFISFPSALFLLLGPLLLRLVQ